MINLRQLRTIRLITALVPLLLAGACAPPPSAGPSTALKEQLQVILQQQQQQGELLQALQLQLEQLQQQVAGEAQVSAVIEDRSAPPAQEPQPTPLIPPVASQEIQALTASASSYLGAFTDLASGRYAAAEAGFEGFLNEFPEHQYTVNARYWLAMAQSGQGKLQLAITNLRQILSDSRGQAKAPATLQELARIYRQQGLDAEADETLEQLRNSYPDSPEAQHFIRSESPQ